MGRLVFISYRRERGHALAHLVNTELRSRGLRTFIDVAESDPGQFWAQAHAAIRSCCAVVLICTNGSFQARAGDDWVLREVSEAMALGRPIVPVFSQDFEPPSALLHRWRRQYNTTASRWTHSSMLPLSTTCPSLWEAENDPNSAGVLLCS